MPAWNEFGPKKQELPPESEDYADLCAAALATPAGRALLAFLHERYVNTTCHDLSSDSALRSADAKRFLIRELEAQTAKGLAQRMKATKREPKT